MDEMLSLKEFYTKYRIDGILVQDLKSSKNIIVSDKEPDEITNLKKRDVRRQLLDELSEVVDTYPDDVFHVKFIEKSEIDDTRWTPDETLLRYYFSMYLLSGLRFIK